MLPKSNATVRAGMRWKGVLRDLMADTCAYLREYFLRNNSEAGFFADKRLCGWNI